MYDCSVCEGAITNPICHHCIEAEIVGRLWKNQKAVRHLSIVTEALMMLPETDLRCVVCGSAVSLCSHCYVNEVKRMMSGEIKIAKKENEGWLES